MKDKELQKALMNAFNAYHSAIKVHDPIVAKHNKKESIKAVLTLTTCFGMIIGLFVVSLNSSKIADKQIHQHLYGMTNISQ